MKAGEAESRKSGSITKKMEDIIMKYSKPKALAQNAKQGSYAAGCPEQHACWHSCQVSS